MWYGIMKGNLGLCFGIRESLPDEYLTDGIPDYFLQLRCVTWSAINDFWTVGTSHVVKIIIIFVFIIILITIFTHLKLHRRYNFIICITCKCDVLSMKKNLNFGRTILSKIDLDYLKNIIEPGMKKNHIASCSAEYLKGIHMIVATLGYLCC